MKDMNTILFYCLVGIGSLMIGYTAPFSNVVIPYVLYALGAFYIGYGLLTTILFVMRAKKKSAFTIYREVAPKKPRFQKEVEHSLTTLPMKRS